MPRAGVPILSATLAVGQRLHPHACQPRAKPGGPSPSAAQGAPGRGWVIKSPPPGARTPWWPWGDGSTPREAAPPPAAFPRSESPLEQNA